MHQSDENFSIKVDIYFNDIFINSREILITRLYSFEFIENSVKKLFKSEYTEYLSIYLKDKLLSHEEKKKSFDHYLKDDSLKIKFDISNLNNIIIPHDLSDHKTLMLSKKRKNKIIQNTSQSPSRWQKNFQQ